VTAPPRDRPFRRRLLLNTATTGVANVWAMVVAVVSLPLLLGGLGADGFGLWVLLQTFSALNGWLSLGDLGLATATPRFIAEAGADDDDDRRRALIRTSVTAFAALGTFWATVLALLGPWLLPGLFDVPDDLQTAFVQAVLIVAATAAVDQTTRGCQGCLEGLQRVDLSRWGDVVRRTVGVGGATVAALATGSLAMTALAAFAGSLAGLAFSVVALRRVAPVNLVGIDRSAARQLFAYGRTVAALRPIGVIHRMMDRVIVGIILGPAAVTIVEIATQVQNGAEAVLSASSYAVVPSAAHVEARGDRHSRRDLLVTGTRYSLLATSPFVVGPALLAAPLLAVWIGVDASGAVGPVVLALAYVAATAPLQVGSNMLVGTGRAGAVLKAAGASIVVNLALSLALVGPLGVSGVFVATLVSGVVLIPILGREVLRVAGTSGHTFITTALRPTAPPAAALAVVVVAVTTLPVGPLVTLVLAAGLGAPAYLAVLLHSGMGPGEVRELRAVLARPASAS
jgi:O-antigen/teichoic acid export membrane protein